MNPWSWFQRKAFGETVKDYGEVLNWTELWTSRRLNLKLTRKDGAFFLVARRSTSAGFGGSLYFSRIRVTIHRLERVCQVAQDARDTVAKLIAEEGAESDVDSPRD